MVKLRTHHLLCNYCFVGKGYSDKFTHNLTVVNQSIKTNIPIHVIDGLDDVCVECPKQDGTVCDSQQKVQFLDDKHREFWSLYSGGEITWNEVGEYIKQHMTPDIFAEICHTCEWFGSGICREQLFNSW